MIEVKCGLVAYRVEGEKVLDEDFDFEVLSVGDSPVAAKEDVLLKVGKYELLLNSYDLIRAVENASNYNYDAEEEDNEDETEEEDDEDDDEPT